MDVMEKLLAAVTSGMPKSGITRMVVSQLITNPIAVEAQASNQECQRGWFILAS